MTTTIHYSNRIACMTVQWKVDKQNTVSLEYNQDFITAMINGLIVEIVFCPLEHLTNAIAWYTAHYTNHFVSLFANIAQ